MLSRLDDCPRLKVWGGKSGHPLSLFIRHKVMEVVKATRYNAHKNSIDFCEDKPRESATETIPPFSFENGKGEKYRIKTLFPKLVTT